LVCGKNLEKCGDAGWRSFMLLKAELTGQFWQELIRPECLQELSSEGEARKASDF
jgi:hypothetical protein